MRTEPELSGSSRRFWRYGVVCLVLVLIGGGVLFAQRGGGRRGGFNRGAMLDSQGGVEHWENDPQFKHDVFTFVRVLYSSGSRSGFFGGRGGGGGCWTDYPDSDMNLSFRLQQVTSLKVNPVPKQLELTDPDLFNYPFIYIVEPGRLYFSDEEVKALRGYLLNGGFLMVDDFWGDAEWMNLYEQMKRVFPEREPVELPMDHPVFNAVIPLKIAKNKLQIPNINQGRESEYTGVTWEMNHVGNTTDVHIKGIFDDKGRMMAIICHNTDNGDGWEREGESEYYFHHFSENIAYPMAINIIFYAMTH